MLKIEHLTKRYGDKTAVEYVMQRLCTILAKSQHRTAYCKSREN